MNASKSHKMQTVEILYQFLVRGYEMVSIKAYNNVMNEILRFAEESG